MFAARKTELGFVCLGTVFIVGGVLFVPIPGVLEDVSGTLTSVRAHNPGTAGRGYRFKVAGEGAFLIRGREDLGRALDSAVGETVALTVWRRGAWPDESTLGSEVAGLRTAGREVQATDGWKLGKYAYGAALGLAGLVGWFIGIRSSWGESDVSGRRAEGKTATTLLLGWMVLGLGPVIGFFGLRHGMQLASSLGAVVMMAALALLGGRLVLSKGGNIAS